MTESASELAPARSFLYVPGDRPEMLAKAELRGADALILDLEDAVLPDSKAVARSLVRGWLDKREPGVPQIWVRVNSNNPLLESDLEAVIGSAVTGVYLPKCGSPAQVERVAGLLDTLESDAKLPRGHTRVAPLLESAEGILAAARIATGSRVSHLAIGEEDLSADLGMELSDDRGELLAIRTSVVVASSAAGINPPVGPVSVEFHDREALRTSSEALRRLGYRGRAAIHPAQVPIINEVFTPSASEVAAAQEILSAFDAAQNLGSGVAVGPDGRMIDLAVARKARRVISLARPTSPD